MAVVTTLSGGRRFFIALLAIATVISVLGFGPARQATPARAAEWTAPSFVSAIGGRGEAAIYAWGIEYNPVSDEILVGDYWNFQVRRYDTDGRYLGSFFRSASQRKGQPYTISVDPSNGDIYVAELSDGKPRGYFGRYDKTGAYLGEIRTEGGYPVWAHIGATGALWIADAHNDKTPQMLKYQITNGTATKLLSFGSYGTGNGQMGNELHGVDTDASGNVYVADAGNREVHVFAPNGAWVRDIGGPGTGLGQFTGDLRGVAVDRQAGLLYVVDAAGSQIDVFTLAGTPVRSFGTEGFGAGQFADGGREITLDSEGNVWVADYGNYRFSKFAPDGSLLGTFPDPAAPPPPAGFSQVRDVAVDPVDGSVWAADSWNNRFQKFAPDGTLLDVWGFRNSRPPYGMNYPRGIAVNPANRDVWVSNTRDHMIRVYTKDGDYRFTVGSGADSNDSGSFRWVMDVEFHGGKAFVSDYNGSYWKVLDAATGAELKAVSTRNSGIAVDPSNGWVYVSTWHNDRVYVYDSNYNYKFSFGSAGTGPGQFTNPWDIDIVNGTVYVTDSGQNRIQAFTTAGGYLGTFGSRGSGPGQFIDASGITHDAAGNIYVADAGNNRIQVFSWDPKPTDAAAPSIAISSPTKASTVPAVSPVLVTGTYADDARVAHVEVAIKDTVAGTWWNANLALWSSQKIWNRASVAGAPGGGTFRSSFVGMQYGGAYGVQARAVDTSGATTTTAGLVRFTVGAPPADTTAPRVDFESPAMDAVVPAGPVAITGWVTDDRAVASAAAAVRDRNSGLWWDAASQTWGSGVKFEPVTLARAGAPGSAFTFDFAGAASGGSYYVEIAAADEAGNADTTKPYVRFSAS